MDGPLDVWRFEKQISLSEKRSPLVVLVPCLSIQASFSAQLSIENRSSILALIL